MRSCPKCKTSDYNNKYFVLLINECGHSICKNCVDTLFVRQTGPCPLCGKNLKKSTYWEQIFDDPLIEKQTFFRKKLQKIFNLKQEDFRTLREYNDYLEKIENFVLNLTYDTDVDETKKLIEKFQKENEELIQKNRNKLSKDEEWIQKHLDDERKSKEKSGQIFNENSSVNENTQKSSVEIFGQDARSVIKELMTSNLDAGQIVGRKRYEARKLKEELQLKRASIHAKKSAETFEKLKNFKKSNEEIVPLSGDFKKNEGKMFVYEKQTLNLNGPQLSHMNELERQGYLLHIKPAVGWQKAGGYYEGLGCLRALTDARCDLFLC